MLKGATGFRHSGPSFSRVLACAVFETDVPRPGRLLKLMGGSPPIASLQRRGQKAGGRGSSGKASCNSQMMHKISPGFDRQPVIVSRESLLKQVRSATVHINSRSRFMNGVSVSLWGSRI